MYRSKPCLPYFSSVVKKVASPSVEIRKLVYIYLLQYAESEPDLALLSINTIQKSLTDQNPQIRALALRVMSGIKVPVISQIVSLAIKRGIADMSPFVRKAAALAIPKCYRLDPSTQPQLLEYISTLLGDRQYFVVGPAVMAFLEVCPDRIDLVHKHYHSLVKKLVDMDEWGQLATLRLLTLYSRRCFPIRTQIVKESTSKDFYDDEKEDGGTGEDTTGKETQVLDPDLELFLKSCKPLLSSRSPAVIVSAARCFLHLGTPESIVAAIGPLVALLRGPQDVQLIVMYNIVAVCLVRPESFVRYTTRFLVRATDVPDISRLKFELLTLIFPHCDETLKEMILTEFEHFMNSANSDLVTESVRAIGRCSQTDPATSQRCLHLLLQQISSQDGKLIAESVTVIRHLIQQNPDAHVRTVIKLAKNLDNTTIPEARASIIWLVGEFAGLPDNDNIAPDVLRILAKDFAGESEPAKLQIVLLAAKVYLHHLLRNAPIKSATPLQDLVAQPEKDPPQNHETIENEGWQETPSTIPAKPPSSPPTPKEENQITLLWNYILHLTRYDTSYDLRDRARLYRALLSNPSSTQLASLLLLAPKPVPHTPSPSESRKGLLIGSSSLVIGLEASGAGGVIGYEDLPEWVREGEEPDPKLRELGSKAEYTAGARKEVPAAQELDRAVRERGVGRVGAVGRESSRGKERSLDDWLAEDERGAGGNGDDDDEEEEGSTEEETDSEEYEDEEDEDEDESEEEESSEGEAEGERLVRS